MNHTPWAPLDHVPFDPPDGTPICTGCGCTECFCDRVDTSRTYDGVNDPDPDGDYCDP